MNQESFPEPMAARFLDAWLGVRQVIQSANFNRFQKAGLSATQFMTLNSIPAAHGGMTLSELAHRLNLSPATVTKTLDSLEARGLLTRTRSEVDRRQNLLTLTEEGMRFHNAASTEFHDRITALFAKMPPLRRQELVLGLEALLEAGREATPHDGAVAEKHSAPQSPAE